MESRIIVYGEREGKEREGDKERGMDRWMDEGRVERVYRVTERPVGHVYQQSRS